MNVDAILFDLDGTLIEQQGKPDWEQITAAQVVLVQPFLSAWFKEPEGGWTHLVQTFWKAFTEANPEPPRQGAIDRDRLGITPGPAVLRAVAHNMGVLLDAGRADTLWEVLHGVPESEFGHVVRPATAGVLSSLRAKGLRMALVTARMNDSAWFRPQLSALGLPDVFDAVITSGDAGFWKPHHQVYHRALESVGVPADRTVHVGDSLRMDIEPALELGMHAIHLSANERGVSHERYRRIGALEELLGMIERHDG